MTMNEGKRNQSSIIIVIVLLLLIPLLILLAYRLFSSYNMDSLPDQDDNQAFTENFQDNSVSDYFAEEFAKSPETNEVKSEEADGSRSCELLGQNVQEGTVIYDSTCTSP